MAPANPPPLMPTAAPSPTPRPIELTATAVSNHAATRTASESEAACRKLEQHYLEFGRFFNRWQDVEFTVTELLSLKGYNDPRTTGYIAWEKEIRTLARTCQGT